MNTTSSAFPLRTQRRFLTIEGVPASTPQASLYAQHPSGTPTGGPGQQKWLITEPTRDAPTSRWRSYRETCARLAEHNPGNPLAAAYLEEAERVSDLAGGDA